MSGHSKWATIKRKKGEADAKRGKVFTKVVREITTAARLGGADIGGNPRLRAAVQAAKAARMPADNIERAIKKGTGALDGPPVEETNYEGYGPGGAAFLVEAQTDNRNRTVGEVRSAFTKQGGNMGAAGSVAWLFHARAVFVVAADAPGAVDEERALELCLEAGVLDVRRQDGQVVVEGEAKDFAPLLDALEAGGVPISSAELTYVADTTVRVSGADAERCIRLSERLEELDDVQRIHANFDVDEAELASLLGAP